MLVAAANATLDPMDGRARQNASNAANQTRDILARRLMSISTTAGLPTCPDRALESLVGVCEPLRNSGVASECIHHPAVAGQGKETAMPDAHDDKSE